MVSEHDIITQIIGEEWIMFDQVQGSGGRATCQNDSTTFQIMRSSQLQTWNASTLASYWEDIQQAKKEHRNLLTEKYAYMMEFTDPAEFAYIKNSLPPISNEKQKLVQSILDTHSVWYNQLAQRFPRIIGQGRPFNTAQHASVGTSFEIYLRGELYSYSVNTLKKYHKQVEASEKKGVNLHRSVLTNTVREYGFSSLEAAEEALCR